MLTQFTLHGNPYVHPFDMSTKTIITSLSTIISVLKHSNIPTVAQGCTCYNAKIGGHEYLASTPPASADIRCFEYGHDGMMYIKLYTSITGYRMIHILCCHITYLVAMINRLHHLLHTILVT